MKPPFTIAAAPSLTRAWTSFALVAMLLASVFSSAIGMQYASAQDTQRDLASAVPADSVLFMSLNLDQNSDQWMLAQDLMVRSGLSDLAENEVGVSTDDLGDLAEDSSLTGSGAIVFTSADALVNLSTSDFADAALVVDPASATATSMDMEEFSSDVPEGFALIMQPNDSEALSQMFLDMVNGEADDNFSDVQTVEYSGVTITFWESTDSENPGTATTEVDGTVVLATRASDIEPIIDAVQGNVDTLDSADGFNAVSDKLPSETLSFGYMNLDVMISAVEINPDLMSEFGDLLASQDVEQAKGHIGWAMYASDAGFHMDTVTIPNDPTMIQDLGTFTPSMANKIPADVMVFGNANDLYSTGVADILAETMQVAMDESDEDFGTMATPVTTDEAWAMMEDMLGFNPNTDLLAKLDGEFAAYMGVYDLESGMPTPEFLFVSGTSDATTLDQTMATITNMMNASSDGEFIVSSRTIDGSELTVITMDPEASGGIPVVIEFGVVNDEMLIGMNGTIDTYLDGSVPMLADDANFQTTFDALPSGNIVSVSYMNIEGQVIPMLDWLTTDLLGSMTSLDNHEDCGEYATQLEAQDAYDADPDTLWLLDMNFNGIACEDYFGDTMPEASPVTISSQVNIPAAGSVTWTDDDAMYTSSILVIGD